MISLSLSLSLFRLGFVLYPFLVVASYLFIFGTQNRGIYSTAQKTYLNVKQYGSEYGCAMQNAKFRRRRCNQFIVINFPGFINAENAILLLRSQVKCAHVFRIYQ